MASARSVMSVCGRKSSIRCGGTKRSSSATRASAFSTSCRNQSPPSASPPMPITFITDTTRSHEGHDGHKGFFLRNLALVAYIDGGARGNPGPAGFGVRIERPDATLVEEFSESIGVATNNVAEYRGLIAALEWAKRHGARELHVRSDSLLLVQQMRGAFKVKNAGLQPLYARARVLVHDVGRVTFEHVGRALNAHAD